MYKTCPNHLNELATLIRRELGKIWMQIDGSLRMYSTSNELNRNEKSSRTELRYETKASVVESELQLANIVRTMSWKEPFIIDNAP